VAYVPREHATGASVVEAQEKPAGHAVQVISPAKEYLPEAQLTGTDDDEAQD
jgi:hypothetical protein